MFPELTKEAQKILQIAEEYAVAAEYPNLDRCTRIELRGQAISWVRHANHMIKMPVTLEIH